MIRTTVPDDYAVLALTAAGKKARDTNQLPAMPEDLASRDLANELRQEPKRKRPGRFKTTQTRNVGRPPKRADVLGAEKLITEKVQTFDLERLHKLWLQNVHRLGDPSESFKHGSAKRIVDAIENEWQRRLPFVRKHPEYFKWPSTQADGGNGHFEIGGAPGEGMLAYLEYHVGRTKGLPVEVRRAILDRVVEGTLSFYWSLEYYDEWGEPGTAARLQKLAETIAALTRNAKRRRRSVLSDAVSEWESDLAYLKQKYYLRKWSFGWPFTN